MPDEPSPGSESPASAPQTPQAEPPGGRSSGPRALIAGVLLLLLIAVVVVVVVVGGGGDDDGDGAASGLAENCEDVSAPEPKQLSLEPPADLTPRPATAVVETSCGTFEIDLDDERAPATVASFEFLVEEGVYDGTTFHRIVPDFVIQGGDPAGDGTGGPGPDYFVDEPPPGNLSYLKGIVAMAKSEAEPPGRSGSQFFVVLAPDAGLAPDFALVGEVSEGFDVVERIATLGDEASEDGTPLAPVLIERITLSEGQ